MLSLVCAAVLVTPQDLRILFLGNSHTASNDLTGMVRSFLATDGSGRKVTIRVETSALLNDFAERPDVLQQIKTGKWTTIVLQGAAMSSSHKYVYSQAGGIAVAKLAVASGASTRLFAEWPRQGWDETGYILGIYGQIAAASGATIIPVPRCWDVALSLQPGLSLWASDGNHSSPIGAYLAACGLYYGIAGPRGRPVFVPSYLTPKSAETLRSYALKAIFR